MPVVLKFDGLAAGKGVAVCTTPEMVDEFLATVFVKRAFGEGRMVVEECLTGPELSVFCSIVDGAYHLLTPARDYKRIRDNDEGPNTGGMGAYSPAPAMTDALARRVMADIIAPTIAAMAAEGRPFKGVLYAGLMIDDDGTPNVIEFNCRFGDPETQVILPLVTAGLVNLLHASATGAPLPPIEVSRGAAVTTVLAAAFESRFAV